MSQRVIIDGYNVIYTDETLRRKACRDLEGARRDFLDKLKGYVARRRLKVTVVFDGRGGMVDAETVIPGRLQVLYSASSQTADEVIVATLKKSGNPAAYIVVTSDMADIGRAAKAMGCEVIGSKRFLQRIVGGAASGPNSARETPSGKRAGEMGDTDYWLGKFAGDDETNGGD